MPGIIFIEVTEQVTVLMATKLKKFRLHYLPDDYQEEKILNDQYPDIFNNLKKRLVKETNLNIP